MYGRITPTSIFSFEQSISNNRRSQGNEEYKFLMNLIACFDSNEIDWVKIVSAMVSNGFQRTRSQCQA